MTVTQGDGGANEFGSGGALIEARLPGLQAAHRGKVRDTFDLGDHLLMVATDRLSAFDVVLPDAIPDRGRVLTQLAAWWFERSGHLVPNHFVTLDPEMCPPVFRGTVRSWQGRAMLVRKARPLPVECIVRGYMAGSAWTEYQQSGEVAGEALPPGLEPGSELPRPIFTPTTKAATGHDLPLGMAGLVEQMGEEVARRLRELSLSLYAFGREEALRAGLLLVDTKFEFGYVNGVLTLIDEALTPDSSRYWEASEHRTGKQPPGLDKQIVRDHLTATGWDHNPPAPVLPQEVVERTREAYLAVFSRLTGGGLRDFGAPPPPPAPVSAPPATALSTPAAPASPRAEERVFRVSVQIVLKPSVADPQGRAVNGALRQLGFAITDVRMGRLVELLLEAPDQVAAEERVTALCKQLLANPVLEDFRFQVRLA